MSSAIHILFVMVLVTHYSMMMCCSGNEVNATSSCVPRERTALLKLKASFYDPSNRLSSWNTSTNCCTWMGIECDKLTGHVVGLDLHSESYEDDDNMLSSRKIDASILELKHLRYMDLSWNDFQRSPIPSFLGSLSELHHLNLSHANFKGIVPHHLGNLSRLNVLDLSGFAFYDHELVVDDFTWASRLSLLKHLDMSSVWFNGTKDLLKVLNMLPSLEVLHFSNSGLENRNLGHAFLNASLVSDIQVLDLSGNSLDELPYFLGNQLAFLRDLDLSFNKYNSCSQVNLNGLTNLVRLDLSYNSLDCNADSISQVLGNNCHMESLEVGGNSFYGDVSSLFLHNLSKCPNHKLVTLRLEGNRFYGRLPEQIGVFSKLKSLSLGGNDLFGPIPTSIGNLSSLMELNLSRNRLNGSIPPTIGNLIALESLSLADNQLSGLIPSSIGNLSSLTSLYLYDNTLSGLIPSSIENLSALIALHLSNNTLSGMIPHAIGNLIALKDSSLDGNQLYGPIPSSVGNLSALIKLDLRTNALSGHIPSSIGNLLGLQFLFLGRNSFTGQVPSTLRNCTQLYILDLSRNGLSGHVPELLTNGLLGLRALLLSSNQLSGVIPKSIGGAHSLEWLQLGDNTFTGEVPSSLRNCTALKVLDVGENSISGEVPKWIGTDLLSLKVIRLKSNKLHGAIPLELCQLFGLQLLDLASNKLTGDIPRCFGNFSGMVLYNSTSESSLDIFGRLQEVIKGVAHEYVRTLRYVVNMDLSDNNLIGEIPLELTKLVALHFLNLSHNELQGNIPGRIGDMKLLESLDLSNNNIFGNIPLSLSDLSFLSRLNLSNNNLTGEIPNGRQLQTLEDQSIYKGNPGLCGPPLPKKCHDDKVPNAPNVEDNVSYGDEDNIERIWLYGIITSGFATGFWGAIGVLVFKKCWRYVYFRFADGVIARILGR